MLEPPEDWTGIKSGCDWPWLAALATAVGGFAAGWLIVEVLRGLLGHG